MMNVLANDIIHVELTPEELEELLGDFPEIFREWMRQHEKTGQS